MYAYKYLLKDGQVFQAALFFQYYVEVDNFSEITQQGNYYDKRGKEKIGRIWGYEERK